MSDQNKQIVEKINAAFTENNTEGFLSFCSEDVRWTMVGEKTVEGKAAIREWMGQMEGMEPPKFSVNDLIADGDVAMCRGEMTMKDKDGVIKPYAYCDVYRFAHGKVTELTSYVIQTNKGEN